MFVMHIVFTKHWLEQPQKHRACSNTEIVFGKHRFDHVHHVVQGKHADDDSCHHRTPLEGVATAITLAARAYDSSGSVVTLVSQSPNDSSMLPPN